MENKAFLFSDLHANNKQLSNLYDFITQNKKEIKVLVFAGDVVNMGEPVWFVDKFIEVTDKLSLPLVWVPGNNDFGRSYNRLFSKCRSVEGKVVELEGRRYTGVGGSPASWSGQYAGESMVDKKKIGGSIFISHFPPPGVHNLLQYDLLSPSTSKKYSDSPLVHICGHLHYRVGVAYLGQTKIIQLGSLETGHYAILNLDDLSVKFGRF